MVVHFLHKFTSLTSTLSLWDIIENLQFTPNLIQVKFQIQIFPPFQNKPQSLDFNFAMLIISMTSDDSVKTRNEL